MINAPEENDVEKKRYLYDQVKVESKVNYKPYFKSMQNSRERISKGIKTQPC